MSKQKLTVFQILSLFILTAVAITIVFGCAPLPPIDGVEVKETKVEETDLSKAVRDSIILVRSSFAYEYYKNGDYSAAREHYGVIYANDIDREKNIYRTWADCFVRAGEMDSALFVYEEGVKYFPDDAYLHSSLAIMYRNANRIDDAIREQKEALRIKVGNIDYLMTLADLYEIAENWEAALETYKAVATENPNDADINRRIINITRTHFDTEEYLATMKEAVEQFPDDPKKRFDYGMALLEQGQNEAALEQLTLYSGKVVDDIDGWQALSKIHANLGNFSASIDAQTKIMELQLGSEMEEFKKQLPSTFVGIGSNYLNLGKWSKARKYAYKALEQSPGFGPAYVLLGNIYYQAADAASGASPKYNDKLVYTIAYGQYRKASKSDDPESRSDGERWMSALKGGELIPSKEERFMHSRDSRPKGEKYAWIGENWTETKYIDSYLKTLD